MPPLSAICQSAALVALLFASQGQATSTTTSTNTHLPPSENATRRNAFGIFNAVHSAMRQWGSSLNHNGMSLFLATVPEGQVFYHGGAHTGRPEGLEWLAFEMEHAQVFAKSRSDDESRGPPKGGGPPGEGHRGTPDIRPDAADFSIWDWHVWLRQNGLNLNKRSFEESAQKAIGATGEDDDDDVETDIKPEDDGEKGPPHWRAGRAYFHTYRANRPLNLLYIDGMAAGKSSYGCLDTQDLLLLDKEHLSNRSRPGMGEFERAQGLCDLAKGWAWEGGQIDGFVRAEAGFEIIYCDFSEAGGLDLMAVEASPFLNETGGLPVYSHFEFLRGVSQRYHGLPAGRIHVDWSSMVSAFFYDVNLTNPDASRPELPRLANVTLAERHSIRSRVQQVVAERHVDYDASLTDKHIVDWQGIVDLVVTRYSGRLSQLANDTLAPLSTAIADMLPTLIFPYMNHTDASDTAELQIDRCTNHYLAGALASKSAWTPEDHSIHAAVTEVTRTICTSLFDMRDVLVVDANKDDGEHDTDSSLRSILDNLMSTLQWTPWRECAPCKQPDEVCLIAMFPWGTADDHFNPRCKSKKEIETPLSSNYWMKDWWK